MRFLLAVGACALVTFAGAPTLKRHPVACYVGALALVALYAAGAATGARGGLWPYFMPLMQRCSLAFLLFSVVMFVGVLGDSSRLRARLMPIRRQLSIIACILTLGHIAFYGVSYAPRLGSAFANNLGFSLALAALLVTLMTVLLVTSFQAVKRRMNAMHWKRVQRLAYPFYLFTYVHLALLLAPSAFAGRDTAIVSLAVYSVVVAAYAVLRVRRALLRQQTVRPSAALAG